MNGITYGPNTGTEFLCLTYAVSNGIATCQTRGDLIYDMQYKVVVVSGGYSSAPTSNGVFTAVPPYGYTVTAAGNLTAAFTSASNLVKPPIDGTTIIHHLLSVVWSEWSGRVGMER